MDADPQKNECRSTRNEYGSIRNECGSSKNVCGSGYRQNFDMDPNPSKNNTDPSKNNMDPDPLHWPWDPDPLHWPWDPDPQIKYCSCGFDTCFQTIINLGTKTDIGNIKATNVPTCTVLYISIKIHSAYSLLFGGLVEMEKGSLVPARGSRRRSHTYKFLFFKYQKNSLLKLY